MIYEDWDEGYEPPESGTYAGGSNSVAPIVFSESNDGPSTTALQEQLAVEQARVNDLIAVISDIRELLSLRHKLNHDDFVTQLAGIVTSAPRHPTATNQNKDSHE